MQTVTTTFGSSSRRPRKAYTRQVPSLWYALQGFLESQQKAEALRLRTKTQRLKLATKGAVGAWMLAGLAELLTQASPNSRKAIMGALVASGAIFAREYKAYAKERQLREP